MLIASLGDRAQPVAVRLLADLRAADIAATMAFGGRSLRSQMREASKQAVRYTLILGEDEIGQRQHVVVLPGLAHDRGPAAPEHGEGRGVAQDGHHVQPDAPCLGAGPMLKDGTDG